MLKSYLKKIYQVAKRSDAREESYYSALERLLDEYAESTGRKDVYITTLPKKTEAGNPDFRIWDGKQHITGYVEAKAPTIKDLDQIETTEQLKRYLDTFPNVILTNFFEFRLYRNGDLVDKVLIARPFIVHKLKTIPPPEKKSDFLELLDKFFSFSLPKVYDAKNLAKELANRTRFLKDEVVAEELKMVDQTFLSDNNKKQTRMSVLPKQTERTEMSVLHGFYEAFRQYLISGLTKDEFADLYSQTITYGLFAARIRSENGFNRKLAYDKIPHTIGILREVFTFISFGDLPQQMEWIIDDISEVLAVTDVKNILHRYFHEGKGKDPIVHFYETFLAEYDPKTREKRGVYYTPEAVVSYIVRSLHIILKEHFDKTEGFASDTVTVLDPAAGTLTFLAEAAKLAVDELVSKYGEGGKENLIKEHILKNFYAFELMMAPYAVGHLKMSFLLEELGYKLQKDDRFKLYLTNTLEMEELAQTEFPFAASLSEESHLAGKVKKETPILVILGNPPYSGISANRSLWIETIPPGQKYSAWTKKGLKERIAGKSGARIKHKTFIGEILQGYYMVDGKALAEKNPKWLQDDYVKFIRFAQWKIEQAGEGVLGFITNHGYLDNPTFRGMRQSLMKSFNEIYILDLHGNSLKKERCPDGSKDENVFDIRQGVAIALFIKKKSQITDSRPSDSSVTLSEATGLNPSNKSIDSSASLQNDKETESKVYHSPVWGLRKKKTDWLLKNDIRTAEWKKLSPKSEFYLFIPRDERLLASYEKYPKITEILPLNGVGMTTARDSFVIDRDKDILLNRIRLFKNSKYSDIELHTFFRINKKKGWSIRKAWNMLQSISDDDLKKFILPVLYRPFDTQWIFYHDSVVWRTVKRVMHHMLAGKNLGLIFHKREELLIPYSHFLVTTQMVEHGCLSSKTTCYLAPLYLYPEDLFTHKKTIDKRHPNISPKLFTALSESYEKEPTPEEIFYYVYAVLYSNTYRTKYAEFLKTDFPRVPFTNDYRLFQKMAGFGESLVALHLMKPVGAADESPLEKPVAKFQGKGDNRVDKMRYDEKQNRVYISKDQYFEGIAKEVWQYQIGGYQVCYKWLKDRKSRNLSLDDIKHYCRIVTAIKETIEIQKEIDGLYPEVEKGTIEFENSKE